LYCFIKGVSTTDFTSLIVSKYKKVKISYASKKPKLIAPFYL
jgi:hypothetical protein